MLVFSVILQTHTSLISEGRKSHLSTRFSHLEVSFLNKASPHCCKGFVKVLLPFSIVIRSCVKHKNKSSQEAETLIGAEMLLRVLQFLGS